MVCLVRNFSIDSVESWSNRKRRKQSTNDALDGMRHHLALSRVCAEEAPGEGKRGVEIALLVKI